MIRAAVFGNPVIHSLSPELFQIYFNGQGRYFRVHCLTSDDIKKTAGLLELNWFNITSPLKKTVLEICQNRPDEHHVPNVSNLVINNSHPMTDMLLAFNTDVNGIKYALEQNFTLPDISSALIIGAGGAAKAALQALKLLKINASIYNRTESKARRLAEKNGITVIKTTEEFYKFDLIINTVPWEAFKKMLPIWTCRKKGGNLNIMTAQYTGLEGIEEYRQECNSVADGTLWLAAQALESYKIYLDQIKIFRNNCPKKESDFYNKAGSVFKDKVQVPGKSKAENSTEPGDCRKLFFITGFSGTGKSSILKNRIVKESFQTFDLDSIIAFEQKKEIFQIIEEKGIEYFRELEKHNLQKLIHSLEYPEKRNTKNVLIALGGGTLINKDNQELVKKMVKKSGGGCIWLLDDPVISAERTRKSSEKRPLLPYSIKNENSMDENAVNLLWQERKPGYENTCTLVIPVFNCTVKDTVKSITSEIQNLSSQSDILKGSCHKNRCYNNECTKSNITITLPPFKSSMIRHLFLAAFSEGKSEILCRTDLLGDDVHAMILSLKRMGIKISLKADAVIIEGSDLGSIFFSQGQTLTAECSESALCARIFSVFALFSDTDIRIIKSKTLNKRPVQPNESIKHAVGILKPVLFNITSGQHTKNPISLDISVSSSSQYLTGLLLVCSAFYRPNQIVFNINDPVSKPYIELTISAIRQCGINAFTTLLPNSTYRVTLMSGQACRPVRMACVPDISGAGFLISTALLKALYSKNSPSYNTIRLKALTKDCLEMPDAVVFSLLEDSWFSFDDKGFSLYLSRITQSEILYRDNPCEKKSTSTLSEFTVDCSDNPDVIMPLSVLAAFIPGECTFKNIKRLSSKETDRPLHIISMLKIIGIETELTENDTGNLDLTIKGKTPDKQALNNLDFDSLCSADAGPGLNDHRFVMALCAIFKAFFNSETLKECLKRKGLLKTVKCISKSFPDFIELIEYM